jgi:hypothetical protein
VLGHARTGLSPATAMDHVFAYGSLVAAGGRPARLRGHRRYWGVAMDNTRDLPGYKHYVDETGARPGVCVAFLDIEPDLDADVDGVCLPVDPEALAVLDVRERNYRRIDVSGLVDPSPGDGRIWAYTGLEESRERLSAARLRGTAVIAAAYRDIAPEVDPGGLEVRALTRIDHV